MLRGWAFRVGRRRLVRQGRLLLLVLAVAILASTAVTSVGLLIAATEQSAIRTSLHALPRSATTMSVEVIEPKLSIAATGSRIDNAMRSVLGLVSGVALRPVTRMREQARLLSQSASADTLPVGPVRDELSALAETLNAFITSVRSASDRERQMVADASHELRTPVAVLRTQLQLAHLESGDAVALEREITAAEVTLDRLSNLTTNLLTLSRIEAGDAAPRTSGDALLSEFYGSMDRAIVKAIATRSGGDARLAQRREGGLVVTVELPLLG